MSKWILHHAYYGEGNGGALPFVLSDREKCIIERMEDGGIMSGSQCITFVEIELPAHKTTRGDSKMPEETEAYERPVADCAGLELEALADVYEIEDWEAMEYSKIRERLLKIGQVAAFPAGFGPGVDGAVIVDAQL